MIARLISSVNLLRWVNVVSKIGSWKWETEDKVTRAVSIFHERWKNTMDWQEGVTESLKKNTIVSFREKKEVLDRDVCWGKNTNMFLIFSIRLWFIHWAQKMPKSFCFISLDQFEGSRNYTREQLGLKSIFISRLFWKATRDSQSDNKSFRPH